MQFENPLELLASDFAFSRSREAMKKKTLHREQKLRDQHTLSLPRYLGRIFALNIATGSRE